MKKPIIILGIIALIADSCGGQSTNKQISNRNNNMEGKLDLKRLEREAEKTVYDNGAIFYYLEYKEEDGITVIIQGDKIDGFTEERTSKSPYYWNYKKYYSTGIIKEKGTFFGRTSIGLWYSFDKQGKLIKTEDKDKKFGKFEHKDVLNFLIENNYVEEVEKDIYKSVFEITITFSVEDLIWRIIARDPSFMVNDYVLDGETGDIITSNTYQGGKM